MLGGDVGRMRREAWARALEVGKGDDRKFAMRLRGADDDVAREARIRTLLEAFFVDGGEGIRAGKRRVI